MAEPGQVGTSRSDQANHAPSPVGGIKGPVTDAEVTEVLRTIYDPEIPVNIYELGLIYDIAVQADSAVHIKMTLTSPACPVAGTLPPEIESKVKEIDGVTDAKVEVVWEPPWTPQMMSEAAKLQLNVGD